MTQIIKSFKIALFALILSLSNLAAAAALTQRDDGDEPGELMSLGEAVSLFVGIPALVFVLLVIFIWAPSRGRSKSTDISAY